MAIYYIDVRVIQRSAGRSSVAAAAYRSADRLEDRRVGLVHDFELKEGVVHTEIIAPEGAPPWAHDRSKLWNAAEKAEIRRDGQPAREILAALPKELTLQQQVELVREYVQKECVERGMVADFAIHHDNVENPHVHIGLTMRNLDQNGFGKKNRSWNAKPTLYSLREGWSIAINRGLQRGGHSARVDHRSYKEQGLRIIGFEHVGIERHQDAREGRNLVEERLARNDRVAFENGEAIRKDPTVALEALTHHEATFTRRKAAVWLNSRTLDEEQFQDCLRKVMTHEQVVRVGTDDHGVEVFSTKEMLASERNMLDLGEALVRCSIVNPAADKIVKLYAKTCDLSDEQEAGLRHVVQTSGDLALVEGLAGTGKSTMFRAARQVWEQEGHRVIGMALSGKAAEGLATSAGIGDCRSIAGWEWAWDRDRDVLRRGDVVVLDEAGMVGTRQIERLLKRAHDVGAKVVLAGDSEQIQAVEAGCPFSELGKRTATIFMRNIRRQKEPWQREASVKLASGQVGRAIDAYEAHGSVHGHQTQKQACENLVDRYVAYAAAHPGKHQLALTLRKEDVAELNVAIRGRRQKLGELGDACRYETEKGRLDLSVHDRLCFLENNKDLGVKNGTLGTVEKARVDALSVRLDGPDGPLVTFDPRMYTKFSHGYALTVHKAQGVTVDHAHVLTSRAFDRHATYVAMTRHREGLDVYHATDEFQRSAGMRTILSRTRYKELALSYVEAEKQNQDLQRQLETAKEASQKAAKAQWRASQERLEDLSQEASRSKSWAATQPLTVEDAFARTPAGERATQDWNRADENKRFWDQQSAKAKEQHPLAAKVGLSNLASVVEPRTGESMRIQEGLQRSKEAMREAQGLYDRAWHNGSVQGEAQNLLLRHNGAIEQAKVRLPLIKREMAEVEQRRDLLPSSAQPVYWGQEEQKRRALQQQRGEAEHKLNELRRSQATLQDKAKQPSLGFAQALRSLPEVRAATKRLEAAIEQRDAAKKCRLRLSHAAPKTKQSISDLLGGEDGLGGAPRGERLTQAEQQACRELKDARRDFKDAWRDPQLQQAASAMVRADWEKKECALAKLPDFEVKAMDLAKQNELTKTLCKAHERALGLGR